MKSEKEIRANFENLYSRRLAKRKQQFLAREHLNCKHNVRFRIRGNGKCGFCRNDKVLTQFNNRPYVCDEEGTAKTCEYFECRNTPESVEQDFEEILKSPARCGKEYPKLAVLIWCLQDKSRRTRFRRLSGTVCELARAIWALITFEWW